MNIPSILYLIPLIESHTNGGDYWTIYSDTPSKEINDHLLDNPRYNYSFPGTDDPITGEYMDNDYFIQTWINPKEEIIEDTTDPDEILFLLYSPNYRILGYENLNIYPTPPPIQGPKENPYLPDGSILF